ncbi:MAG: nicotinate (nicotinamide) nucleotide adenylyltransferase [Omnitrophica bacterium RIFOXYB12_FULL_50_7]|nr:MAG: nicotinate (nicotinamide) nucleotide adenylyltransferase [Omnitrophica bacterium RIFOXYB12_FULL_50_7]
MKIGIFGGTFDPVHRGHLQLAQNARAQFSLDKVIFVPAYQSPHKQELLSCTSPEDRYEMVRLAIEGEFSMEVSDCELKRKGVSYTFDTLSEFEKKYSGATFFLILGRDAFEGIDAWYRADELKKRIRFLVAKRGACEVHVPEGARAEWIQMPLCPISASGIREAIKCERNVDDHVSSKVLQYIYAHALYREN